MIRNWLRRLAVLLAAAACMAPGCNDDVLKDSTFRLWCGEKSETLCDWRLDAGSVRRVGTWHPDDYGVELVEIPTQISQDTAEGSECMRFSAVADVDASARAKMTLDFDFDGVTDFEVPIGESHWHSVEYLIHAPEGFGKNLRLSLRKDGDGRVALAKIRLQRATSCAGGRIEMKERPIGSACASDAQCKSGLCDEFVVGEAEKPGGTGVWPGTCQQCDEAHPCSGGSVCSRRTAQPPSVAYPLQCAPAGGLGTPGDPCLHDDDCASGACEGAVNQRSPACEASDESCATVSRRAGQCR